MASAAGCSARLWLAAAMLAAAGGLRAQSLQVRAEPGRIRVAPAKSQFLDARSRDRLHNGATVTFAIQLALAAGAKGPALARSYGRFAMSLDIWEEKYAVTRLASPRKTVSHLSAAEAEAWCLDELILTDAGLSPDSSFWIRLEVRAEEPEDAPAAGEAAGMTLAKLVEIFSRAERAGERRTRAEAGPFRLRDLR